MNVPDDDEWPLGVTLDLIRRRRETTGAQKLTGTQTRDTQLGKKFSKCWRRAAAAAEAATLVCVTPVLPLVVYWTRRS